MDNFTVCRGHFPAKFHYRHCMAKALQRRLKRLGYQAAQSQGVITTDASHQVVLHQIVVMEDTRFDWHRGEHHDRDQGNQ